MRDSARHVLSVLLENFAGITVQSQYFHGQLKVRYLCFPCFRDARNLVSLD